MKNLVLPVVQVCERLHATLSKKSCAIRYVRSNKAHSPRNSPGSDAGNYCVACWRCEIGAQNAKALKL